MAVTEQVRTRREEIVREHMESENVHDHDTTIGTFHHPRYELIGNGRGLRRRSRGPCAGASR